MCFVGMYVRTLAVHVGDGSNMMAAILRKKSLKVSKTHTKKRHIGQYFYTSVASDVLAVVTPSWYVQKNTLLVQ